MKSKPKSEGKKSQSEIALREKEKNTGKKNYSFTEQKEKT